MLKKIPSQSSEENINDSEKQVDNKEKMYFENDQIIQIQEVSISDHLKKIKLKGIIEIKEVFDSKNYYFITSALCKGPSLEKYITNGNYNNNNELLLNHFLQIANDLQGLHTERIVHMDLKADNVMFAEKGCKDLIIIDLGTAIYYNEKEPLFKERQQKGTIKNYSYDIADSISKGEVYDSSKYDIWCLGLILYHMYFGEELFPKYNFTNILNAGLSFGNKKKYVKNVLKDRKNFNIKEDSKVKNLNTDDIIYTLLTNILTKEDEKRWTLDNIIKEIKKHLNLKEKK